MTCDERNDLIFLYAADALDDGEQQQDVRAHLASGCATCAQTLEEAGATLGRLPAALDPVAPPTLAVERLMRRVEAERSVTSTPTPSSTSTPSSTPFPRVAARPRRVQWGVTALAACVGLVVGGLALHFLGHARYQRELSDVRLAMADRDRQLGELTGMLRSEQLKFVSLAQAESPAHGRILWDQQKRQWHVYVFDLKPPPAGRTYELWFITPDQRKIPSKTFDVDADGHAATTVDVPAGIGPIALAAITDEPAGGSDVPTGSVHLAGQVP